MTIEEFENALLSLYPGADYCIAPEILAKRDIPRRVTVKVHVWTGKRTLIHEAAYLEEILEALRQDLRRDPSRIVLGSFGKATSA